MTSQIKSLINRKGDAHISLHSLYAVGIISLVVLGGWLFRATPLTSWFGHGVTMKPITCLLALITCISILCIHLRCTILSLINSFLLFNLSSLILIASIIKAVPVTNESSDGLPSIGTSLSFLALAVGCLITALGNGHMRVPRKFLAIFVGTLGVVALIGHVLGFPSLYWNLSVSYGMAVPTALCFIFLGLSLHEAEAAH